MKSTLHTQYRGPRVPNFGPFGSTISRFQNIAHFRIFPLTPMLTFQSATKFLILADCQIIYSFNSLTTTLFIIKSGSARIKTVGGVAFWNFQPHMVLCLQKFQSAIKFLTFGRNVYNFLFPRDYLICNKVWLRLDKKCGRSSVLKFMLPWGPMLTNMRKKNENWKFWKNKKNDLEIWWKGNYP